MAQMISRINMKHFSRICGVSITMWHKAHRNDSFVPIFYWYNMNSWILFLCIRLYSIILIVLFLSFCICSLWVFSVHSSLPVTKHYELMSLVTSFLCDLQCTPGLFLVLSIQVNESAIFARICDLFCWMLMAQINAMHTHCHVIPLLLGPPIWQNKGNKLLL